MEKCNFVGGISYHLEQMLILLTLTVTAQLN